jgi:hypothetical protein
MGDALSVATAKPLIPHEYLDEAIHEGLGRAECLPLPV